MTYPKTDIISHRCDESMKRSKEQGFTPWGKKWKCDGQCRNCFCCIIKDENGDERHRGMRNEC